MKICGRDVVLRDKKDIELVVSEFTTGAPFPIPVTVVCGVEEKPVMFLTGAVHGDELNGVEIVRRLVASLDPATLKGTVIAAPIVNRFGFIAQSRYLPDRRDLNRVFPGRKDQSMASRIAWKVFEEIVRPAQFGVDVHTASLGRSNMPHVRGYLHDPEVRRMAKAAGSTVILNNRGTKGSLRRAATDAGIPTLLIEAGEALKFQEDIVEAGLTYTRNIMVELGMLAAERVTPPFQTVVSRAKWVRASRGGILEMRVRPGDLVYEGDVVALNTNPFGAARATIVAPFTGMVVGVTTLPFAHPGDPVCHMVQLERTLPTVEKHLRPEGVVS